MGELLTKTVDRAIGKGWIPSIDRENVINGIEQLASKYGFNSDSFAVLTHIESYGMNPASFNSINCAGIIQFCPDRKGSTIKRIGGTNYDTLAIKRMSILQQLSLVDKYFEGLIPASKRNNIDLGHLYFYVLYPAVAAQYDKYSYTDDLKVINKALEKQADKLYVGNNKRNPMTKQSVIQGLLSVAEGNLGGFLNTSIADLAGGSGGGSFNNTIDAGIQSSSFIGDTLNQNCSEDFPSFYSLKEALTYQGCFNRIAQATVSNASSLSYPSAGMKINDASGFEAGAFNPVQPLCPNCLGYPFNEPTIIETSPFCQRRISKVSGNVYYHSGVDYATTLGVGKTEGMIVIAVADGIVVKPKVTGGYQPGLVDIVHPQLGNLLSRSAHVIPIVRPGDKVKQGQPIAKVGPYGNKSAHLHLELRKDGGAGGSARTREQCNSLLLNPSKFCKRR